MPCREVMRVANENNISSVAFCAISCGIFGYPTDKAAKVQPHHMTHCETCLFPSCCPSHATYD